MGVGWRGSLWARRLQYRRDRNQRCSMCCSPRRSSRRSRANRQIDKITGRCGLKKQPSLQSEPFGGHTHAPYPRHIYPAWGDGGGLLGCRLSSDLGGIDNLTTCELPLATTAPISQGIMLAITARRVRRRKRDIPSSMGGGSRTAAQVAVDPGDSEACFDRPSAYLLASSRPTRRPSAVFGKPAGWGGLGRVRSDTPFRGGKGAPVRRSHHCRNHRVS